MQLIGAVPVVRKVLARGNKANNEGSQLVIYDLVSGDLVMPANPDGCVFVGVLPAAAPGGGGGQPGQGGGQMMVANARSNIVTAGCFGANRQLHGVMSLHLQ